MHSWRDQGCAQSFGGWCSGCPTRSCETRCPICSRSQLVSREEVTFACPRYQAYCRRLVCHLSTACFRRGGSHVLTAIPFRARSGGAWFSRRSPAWPRVAPFVRSPLLPFPFRRRRNEVNLRLRRGPQHLRCQVRPQACPLSPPFSSILLCLHSSSHHSHPLSWLWIAWASRSGCPWSRS